MIAGFQVLTYCSTKNGIGPSKAMEAVGAMRERGLI